MIDVHDCDARLPGLELPNTQSHLTPAEAQQATSLLFMGEFVKLSVLLGKVIKTIYSPTGLIHTTDEALEELLGELDRFSENIPPELQYQGRNSNISAGLLHMFYACVCMMFWRVFARILYFVPAHLKFALVVERWSALTRWSGESMDWLDAHEHVYDSWFLVAYSITSCALVQYHTWVRRKDPDAQECLRRLKDCVKRWDRTVEPGHMPTRRKTTEIISLLYEATQSPVPPNVWPENPTAGVESRNPEDAEALVFKKDPSRPGGGLFIATQRTARALGEDIPNGTLVIPDPQTGEEADITTNVYPKETTFSNPTTNGSTSTVTSLSPPTGDSFIPVTTPLRPVDDTTARQTNVNPGMNSQNEVPYGVQVINMLDQSQNLATMQQDAAVNNGYLDGIPATMFEFDQWDSFFQRFQTGAESSANHGGPSGGFPGAGGNVAAASGYGLQPSQSF